MDTRTGEILKIKDAVEEQKPFLIPIKDKDIKCISYRKGNVTTYVFKLSLKQIFPVKMITGTTFGFGIIINDADKEGKRIQGLVNTPVGTEPHRLPELWPAAVLVRE